MGRENSSIKIVTRSMIRLVDDKTLSFHEMGVLLSLIRFLGKSNILINPETNAAITDAELTKQLGFIKTSRTKEYLKRLESVGILSNLSLNNKSECYSINPKIVRFISSDPSLSTRKNLTPSIRFAVLNRDGFSCKYCGRGTADGVKLHVDHITPVALGGTNSIENLVTSCQECNAGKRAMELAST